MVSFFVEKERFVKNIVNPLYTFGVSTFTLNVENEIVYSVAPKKEANSVFFGYTDVTVPGFTGNLRFADLNVFKRAIDNLKSDLIKFNVFDNHITCSDDNGYAFKLYLMSDLSKEQKLDKNFFLKFPEGATIILDKKKFQELSSLNSLASDTKKLYIEDVGDKIRFLFSDKEKSYSSEFDRTYNKNDCGIEDKMSSLQISSEIFSWTSNKDVENCKIIQNKSNNSVVLVNVDQKYYVISQLEK